MTSESRPQDDADVLAIELDPGHVPVSYLSSLLRVVQAALREVAMSNELTRPQFARRPQPVLLVPSIMSNGDLTLQVTFSRDSTPLRELSSQIFNAFLDRFSEFVRGLPQRGLWGGASYRPSKSHFESEVMRRMDQVYRELRRSPKVTVRFQGRSIEIEGDRMEIA